MNRIIYYYQTLVDIEPIIISKDVTHIHLSSIHFGYTNNKPYIHLNDNHPDDPKFYNMWNMIYRTSFDKKVILMVGGAGKAFQTLFNNFETFYNILYHTIIIRPFISGIDLDIEENVSLDNVKMLISRIRKDFGKDFIISMAPIQGSMEDDMPGIGGFIYKELYDSEEGKMINYFNVQAYGDYSMEAYNNIINNGYPCDMIVFGMVSSQYDKETFIEALCVISLIKIKYPNFGGVFVWEYYNAPPFSKEPIIWSRLIKQCVKN